MTPEKRVEEIRKEYRKFTLEMAKSVSESGDYSSVEGMIVDWWQAKFTQYHQDLMSEVVEKLRKASYFANFGWKEQPNSFKSMQSPDVKKQIIDFTEAQNIIKSLSK